MQLSRSARAGSWLARGFLGMVLSTLPVASLNALDKSASAQHGGPCADPIGEDCNSNGVADACDIAQGTSADCNTNAVPDECDAAAGSPDCNNNLTPDSCELVGNDCNSNGVPDDCEVANGGGVPHNCCQTGHGAGCSNPAIQACVCAVDSYCCNVDWDAICVEEVIELECGSCSGGSNDCNNNGTPDDCELAGNDCNNNATLDVCDIALGASQDCQSNGLPDECEIGGGGSKSYSATPAAPIPDNNPAGVSNVITVADGGSIEDVNVTLHINHTWQGDLVVTLSHDDTTVSLINRAGTPGGGCTGGANFGYSADNFGSAPNPLVLDDAAGPPINCYAGPGSGSSNYAGPARSAEPLAVFNGTDKAGAWTLTVSDRVPADLGTFVSWSLIIDNAATGVGDCNDNGTPDECELADDDCQSNGVLDECDISGGTSADADSNGVPDECAGGLLVSAVSRKANVSGPGGVCDLPIDLAAGPPIASDMRSDPNDLSGSRGITQVIFTYDAPPGAAAVMLAQDSSCPPPPAYSAYTGSSVMHCMPAGNVLTCTFMPGLENVRTYRLTVPHGLATTDVEIRGLNGDTNSDGRVNGSDRSGVVGIWTTIPGFNCQTDINNNGRTNSADRSAVVGYWTSAATNCAP